MDERTLRVLEYPKIKQMLTERCASSLGKARAEALTPSTSLRRARAALSETSEAAALSTKNTVRFRPFAPAAGTFV